MKFCTETVKDLDKYFRNTFVKFVGLRGKFSDGTECAPAEELVHSVEVINNSYIKGKRWENGEAVPYQFMLYSEKQVPAPEIEFILPRKSYFNTDDGAMLLQRIPARQYRRGVCGDNTMIHQLAPSGGFGSLGVQLELMDKYVRKPHFYTFEERPVSYAVSRRIAIAGTKVYVDQIIIGSINYATKTVHVLPLFIPELEAIIKNLGQPGWKVAMPESPKAKAKPQVKPAHEELEF